MSKDILVKQIVEKEWAWFTNLNDENNRASCQDNKEEFFINRTSQWENLDLKICQSYYEDLAIYEKENRNPLLEKYLYMMEFTHKDEYEQMKDILPEKEIEKENLIKQIEKIMIDFAKEVYEKYPLFSKKSRYIDELGENNKASARIYLIGEHRTYSYNTNKLYLEYVKNINFNLVEKIFESIASKKNLGDLRDLENKMANEGTENE